MIKTYAYVNAWFSDDNENHSLYLPVHVHNQDIPDAIHQAVCEELDLEEDEYIFDQSIMLYDYVFVIIFKSDLDRSIVVYNVKF